MALLVAFLCFLAYGVAYVIRLMAREGNNQAAFNIVVATFAILMIAVAALYYLLQRQRGINRAMLAQIEAISEHMPRTSFWARRESGAFEWFFTRHKDPQRIHRQIGSVLSADGTKRPVDATINSSGNSVIPGAPEQIGLDAYRIEAFPVEVAGGDTVTVGMTHQIDSITDNNPMIRGLLPMVSNRFRIHLYSMDLKTVYVYWTKDRWPLGLGVPLDSSTVFKCFHPDDLEPAIENLNEAIANREATVATFRWIGPEGKDSLTMVSSVSPLYDNMGHFCGALSLSYDITSDLSDTLEQVRNKITVHIYEQFLTRLPDFVDPVLNQLDRLAGRMERNSDFAELADLQRSDADHKQLLGNAISGQAQQLRRDLMDLAGAISFMSDSAVMENVSDVLSGAPLSDVCREAFSGLRTMASERDVTVQILVEARFTMHSMGLMHRETFVGALASVLSNAIRFSPQGGSIEVVIKDDETDPRGYLCIEVRDDGPGPDGVDYKEISSAHLLASPLRSSLRDDTLMVLAMLMFLKQGVFLSYAPRRAGMKPKDSGICAHLRIRRAA